MNYKETVDYLYSRLPMFSRIGSSALKKDLVNIRVLCEKLGNPHYSFKSVHVGGTNGKGSVSHMLAAVLQEAGYKTGLYTSPHLRDFRERIRVNGTMIPGEKVVALTDLLLPFIEEVNPSFFEVTVAMAFQYFKEQQVDVAIVEVGLGGRLDSTNIITPDLSVITNIGYDHMNILGHTLPEIAAEKAGIIKPGVPAVIGERRQETEQVFIAKAKETGSNLIFASDEWHAHGSRHIEEGEDVLDIDLTPASDLIPAKLRLDLTGSYQLKNIKTVLSAIRQLKKGGYQLETSAVVSGLRRVKELTGLMGRWQTLQREPLVICDTGHNEDGIREILKNIEQTPHKKLHMVIGMLKDKDVSKVLTMLPNDATYYFCQPALERAKPAEELAAEGKAKGLTGEVYESVRQALAAATAAAGQEDLIFVGGSTFVTAEVV
ncbi:folylpolyglutamate synthase/dihydrofolate synthase family protein [Arcticibacter sp. MXS-1]|uniref:bifunctional folylpolyglutamate synthase/dihydrofolate synthase n=1 Tax=Arcticibacter sp. MXS-1 TaxID=3341726 RepID=UPI0035A8CF1D